MSPAVAGLLLAAGRGRRLGAPKAAVRLGGETLAERGVRMLRAAGCAQVHLVTGAAAASAAGAVPVANPRWAEGMGSSLRAGLDSLPAEVGAVVVALADQPFVTAEAVRRLLAAHRAGAPVAAATYAGRRRNPVLLAREHWREVRALAAGDAGARAFLRARPELVVAVECADVADPADIDTPEDLASAQRRLAAYG